MVATLTEKIESLIRDVPDFPKEGILFKDITPLLSDPKLCDEIAAEIADQFSNDNVDAIACIESRGFFFGPLVAQKLGIPFIPIRKAGKLPYKTDSITYDLEYGTATIEMHTDALEGINNVLIHDDLLATGGTANAAAQLVAKSSNVVGFSFLINLSFLNGEQLLSSTSEKIHSLINY